MASEKPAESTEAQSGLASDFASRLSFPDNDQKDEVEKPAENKDDYNVGEAQTDGPFNAPGGNILPEPEYSVLVTLADMQANPDNPLFSVKSFNQLDLPEALVKGILQMNFRKPSKIQERALPLLLMDPPTNLIAQSQSGTGKTAAFMLNILKRIDLSNKSPQAIVLAPSRELARQTLGVAQSMGQFLEGLQTTAVVPDPSKRGMKYEGQILVGTAGSMMDMLRRKMIDARAVKILVLDEADNMLDTQGMGDQCTRVKSMLPRPIQVVLFSATFPEVVINYARLFAPNANMITLKHDELTVDGIKQLFLDCNDVHDKYATLLKFYGLLTIASSIIFVKTRKTAEELESRMMKEGHHVAQLSGALEGSERDKIIDKFRSGEAKVLITTNVLARGIDVQSVTMVINYDIPELANGEPDPETYLHRIGRTGRFGRVGVAISFVHDKKSWTSLMQIAKYFGVEIQPLPTEDWEAVEEVVKRVIKSSRAGKSTAEMQT